MGVIQNTVGAFISVSVCMCVCLCVCLCVCVCVFTDVMDSNPDVKKRSGASEGGVSTCDSDRSVNHLVCRAVCA